MNESIPSRAQPAHAAQNPRTWFFVRGAFDVTRGRSITVGAGGAMDETTPAPEALDRERPAVVQGGAVVDPLPDLGAGDLGGGGVLHEVVERDAAGAAQP